MTFPTIPTSAATRVISVAQANTTATRTFPAMSGLTKNSGDLLIAICVSYGTSAAGSFSGWDNGFTEIADVGSSGQMVIGAAWKISTGSETAAPTVTQGNTISGHAQMILMSIPGAHPTSAPEVTAGAFGSTTPANPASLSPSWGSADTLWVNVIGNGRTSTSGTFTGVTGAPTNYTNLYDTGTSGGTVVGEVDAAVCFRQVTASAEDTGTATLDTSNARNVALTIAVRPAAGASGDAARTVTIGTSSAMSLGAKASAARTITVASASAGVRGAVGAAARTVTVGTTSAGVRGKLGAASRSLTVGTASTGVRGKVATATAALTLAVTAAGVVSSSGTGAAAKTVTVSTASALSLGVKATATKALTIGRTATGVRGKVGTSTRPITVGTTAAGVRSARTGATRTLTLTVTADGTVTHVATGPTITYWDGTITHTATLLGWWDGTATQPLTAVGWWDGTTTRGLT